MPIITESKALADFCATLKNCEFITVDTEFLREKTYYPKLCLIQLSCPEQNAKAIDPLADGIDLSPLFDLLNDTNILKVFHAGRQDLEIFYNLTGKVPAPVFDTQIAAMVCGYGDSIGYDRLVQNITGTQIDKSSQFTNWSLRPLSDKQLNYALGDVTYLCDVYRGLMAELEKRGRADWVKQEDKSLTDPAAYENDPYETWKRVKIRSPKPKNLIVLRELAAWREKKAQQRNIPKPWLMKDDTLADMASQLPTNLQGLSKIRNLSKEYSKESKGQELLDVIQDALNSPKDTWPVPKKRKQLSASTMATIDVLKLLLKVISVENEVANKIIANADDIEAIALDDNADVPALKGWRREVFGDDALAIKNGKLAIGLQDGKIVKFKT